MGPPVAGADPEARLLRPAALPPMPLDEGRFMLEAWPRMGDRRAGEGWRCIGT